ncbi:YqgQ family protein [Pradoshia sp.]
MKTVYDIQQYLKRFGSYIYMGDRLADLEMMEFEIRELYRSQLIETKEFQTAILILKHEMSLEREKQKKG